MNFETYSLQTRQEITNQLEKYLKTWQENIIQTSPKLEHLINIFCDNVYGGKMIRGMLVKMGYEMVAPGSNPEILKVSAAFEILHSSLLIHDDVIDRSETRRSKPTLYKALGDNHYAISQSICLGDLGFFIAMDSIIETDFDPKLKAKAIALFSQTISRTIIGESLDVELSFNKKAAEDEVLQIQKLKTAYYTIVNPLMIGAVLGGCSGKQIQAIKIFGEKLGIAFQIQDDILGVFGDAKKLGKPVTSDIEEGKITLLFTHALQFASSKDKDFMDRFYGKGKIALDEHKIIKDIFIRSGSLAYSERKMDKYLQKAKSMIPKVTIQHNYQTLILECIGFLISEHI